MHALFHYSLPIMQLNPLIRLCLACGELDLFLFFLFLKKRRKCKGQCISFSLFFYCSGIFLLLLQKRMACCPYECLLQGWHWQYGSFKLFVVSAVSMSKHNVSLISNNYIFIWILFHFTEPVSFNCVMSIYMV